MSHKMFSDYCSTVLLIESILFMFMLSCMSDTVKILLYARAFIQNSTFTKRGIGVNWRLHCSITKTCSCNI